MRKTKSKAEMLPTIETDVKPFKLHVTRSYTTYETTAGELVDMLDQYRGNPICILRHMLYQTDQMIDPAQIDELMSISENWDWLKKCHGDKKIYLVREVAQNVKVTHL